MTALPEWRIDVECGYEARWGTYAATSPAQAIESFFADNEDMLRASRMTIEIEKVRAATDEQLGKLSIVEAALRSAS